MQFLSCLNRDFNALFLLNDWTNVLTTDQQALWDTFSCFLNSVIDCMHHWML